MLLIVLNYFSFPVCSVSCSPRDVLSYHTVNLFILSIFDYSSASLDGKLYEGTDLKKNIYIYIVQYLKTLEQYLEYSKNSKQIYIYIYIYSHTHGFLMAG